MVEKLYKFAIFEKHEKYRQENAFILMKRTFLLVYLIKTA